MAASSEFYARGSVVERLLERITTIVKELKSPAPSWRRS
jgi:hypothetical protein